MASVFGPIGLAVELTITPELQEEDHIAVAQLSTEEAPLPSLQHCFGHTRWYAVCLDWGGYRSVEALLSI